MIFSLAAALVLFSERFFQADKVYYVDLVVIVHIGCELLQLAK